jgi:hypothetical protein
MHTLLHAYQECVLHHKPNAARASVYWLRRTAQRKEASVLFSLGDLLSRCDVVGACCVSIEYLRLLTMNLRRKSSASGTNNM